MRKADVVSSIAEKTGIPKVDILVALEAFFKEVKSFKPAKEFVQAVKESKHDLVEHKEIDLIEQ